MRYLWPRTTSAGSTRSSSRVASQGPCRLIFVNLTYAASGGGSSSSLMSSDGTPSGTRG